MRLRLSPLVFGLLLPLGIAVGCSGGTSEPVGPEMNAIQEYLDENPDQLVDDEEVSESEEFDASGVE